MQYGSIDVLNILLQRMANLKLSFNLRNAENLTPLDVAIIGKKIKCIEALCRRNALCSFPKIEIACYCRFARGPSSSLDQDQLLFSALSKYKLLPARKKKKRAPPRKDPPKITAKHDLFSKTKQKMSKDLSSSISSVKPSTGGMSFQESKDVIPPVGKVINQGTRQCHIEEVKFEGKLNQELPFSRLDSDSSLTENDHKLKAALTKEIPATPSSSVLPLTTLRTCATDKAAGSCRRRSPDVVKELNTRPDPIQTLSDNTDQKDESPAKSYVAKKQRLLRVKSLFLEENPKESLSSSIPAIASPVLVEPSQVAMQQPQLLDKNKWVPPPKSTNSLQVPFCNLYPIDEEDEDKDD